MVNRKIDRDLGRQVGHGLLAVGGHPLSLTAFMIQTESSTALFVLTYFAPTLPLSIRFYFLQKKGLASLHFQTLVSAGAIYV